ncbi:MAG: tRNA uridine-5-carboxymethylaminomethyl(34) synthesis enzyme MnmG [Epsilonproteobacteria bacterium]|nr:MAG: tRNA uridine-5-carboxymethylaminomethyl(34) synthesis enzyme MnmG [Campylobacterota bacterium]RLA64642.1 MAG: tRNA uridine-5-carboxymethylaminomethyl(34) synthesis enzyme MnmG [Campylobacterota bacterium]
MKKFDIIIIGGGHAGIEAAWISDQMGLKVALVSMTGVPLASTPCNPAVGGVGKGQVVREVDALGGLMGKIADLSAIQYRTLNESKGHAVRSTRVQVDKEKYSENAEKIIASSNVEVIREKVSKVYKKESMFHVELGKKGLKASKVIVTTGTFLNGVVHTGEEQSSGGRIGQMASDGLQDLFLSIKTAPTRFKTGTPPRLDRETIDFSKLEPQESDPKTQNFHVLDNLYHRELEQVPCYLTRTNNETLSIIRDNKERSPIFNGQIKGVGPRYCPSIEDKAFRYPERNSHHVFIEPEGLNIPTIYPNGISTSLPKDAQEDFIQTINGLEKAKILVYGYAVEYDVVDTINLSKTLEYKDIPGLYFAGQVNGTSGYEEAAGQGIIAGINASLAFLNRGPLVLERTNSYIGVMVEDLVSNRRDEPYRLFTARAENRLFIREDNTTNRIHQYRKLLGLNSELDQFQTQYMAEYIQLDKYCEKFIFKSNDETKGYFKKMEYGPLDDNVTLSQLLKRSKLDPVATLKNEVEGFLFPVVQAVAISKKYEGYINRANLENQKLVKLGKKKIDWEKIVNSASISNECKQRIKDIRPETFSQAQRIKGIRPATLAFIAGGI